MQIILANKCQEKKVRVVFTNLEYKFTGHTLVKGHQGIICKETTQKGLKRISFYN